MARAIKKLSHGSHQSPQSHFAVPTMEGMAFVPSPVRTLAGLAPHHADLRNTPAPPLPRARLHVFSRNKLPISLEAKGGGETKRGKKRPFRHGGEENWAGKAPRGRRRFGCLGAGMTASGTGRRREERQGSRPKPGVLTIKAGMWFCFKGIMLASPPSIKDSDCTRGKAHHGPIPKQRGAAAAHGVRLGPPPRGLKRKPESVRKQEGNRNVIALSRFLWLEQWRADSAAAHSRAALGSNGC
jgi:hypothetical protein